MPGYVQTDLEVRTEVHTALNAQSIGGLTFHKAVNTLDLMSGTKQALRTGSYRLVLSARNSGNAHEKSYSDVITCGCLWTLRIEIVAAVCGDLTQLDTEIYGVIAGFITKMYKQFNLAKGRIFKWQSYTEPRLADEKSLWTSELTFTLDGWRSHSVA